MTCTQCGAEAAGKFCSSCGASLAPLSCAACGAESAPGARFCTECGAALGRARPGAAVGPGEGEPAPAGGSAAGGSHVPPRGSAEPSRTRSVPRGRDSAEPASGPSMMPRFASGGGAPPVGWWVGGLFLVGLIVFIAYPVLMRGSNDGGAAGGAGGGAPAQEGAGGAAAGSPGGGLGAAPNVDLSSMTPREAADLLYERVMRSVSAQDTTQILNFLPMALAAYDRARPLDADGHFHLSLLHRAGLDYEQALAEARAGLDQHPDHLLNLSAAAEASAELGDSASARDYFSHLLEVYETEVTRDLEEYEAHGGLVAQLRDEARAFPGVVGAR